MRKKTMGGWVGLSESRSLISFLLIGCCSLRSGTWSVSIPWFLSFLDFIIFIILKSLCWYIRCLVFRWGPEPRGLGQKAGLRLSLLGALLQRLGQRSMGGKKPCWFLRFSFSISFMGYWSWFYAGLEDTIELSPGTNWWNEGFETSQGKKKKKRDSWKSPEAKEECGSKAQGRCNGSISGSGPTSSGIRGRKW